MKKPVSPKERGLLKGAIRRVFSRSELRRQILDRALVKDYHDPSRKRVTRWCKCPGCKQMIPAYLMEVDHDDPIIPAGKTLEDMEWTEVIDRVWCDERNLVALCKNCHKAKTRIENAERRKLKKEKKLEKR